ncbi:GGDEF domain-containing protein [Trebonia kvetii]|uniref:GGDEF domain-containing protein n=1 Tax=Trebonia kvetii TaxID=2480626 RepID=A0A6P2BYJ8_9ACTN|nr:GGDEF domain-containing protein [Trebonia kvetii]TVZ03767.1 GGDEF domain-containing protein [Trebonia kvetii]
MHETVTNSRDLTGPAPGIVLFGIGGGLFVLGGMVAGVSAPFYRAGLPAGQRGPESAWIVGYVCAALGVGLGIALLAARDRLHARAAVSLPFVAITLIALPMLVSRTTTFTGAILLLWPILYAGCLLSEAVTWATITASLLSLVAASVVDPHLTVTSYGPMAATQALTVWVMITLQRRVHRVVGELSRQASTDPLTGLANRRALLDTLDREMAAHLRRGKALSLMMIDVDQFKQLNDTAGHDAGDEVLRRLAAVLSGGSRRGDLAARFGGEEFMLIMTDCALPDAVARADQLRAQIAAESVGWDHALTVSIGVAELRRDLPESDAGARLVGQADAALYAAKQDGRNRVEAYQS